MMKRCSIVGCDNPIMEDSKVSSCLKHEEMIIEQHQEERRAYEEDLWEDYQALVRDGMNAGNLFES